LIGSQDYSYLVQDKAKEEGASRVGGRLKLGISEQVGELSFIYIIEVWLDFPASFCIAWMRLIIQSSSYSTIHGEPFSKSYLTVGKEEFCAVHVHLKYDSAKLNTMLCFFPTHLSSNG
jgi:hypothetical protein